MLLHLFTTILVSIKLPYSTLFKFMITALVAPSALRLATITATLNLESWTKVDRLCLTDLETAFDYVSDDSESLPSWLTITHNVQMIILPWPDFLTDLFIIQICCERLNKTTSYYLAWSDNVLTSNAISKTSIFIIECNTFKSRRC